MPLGLAERETLLIEAYDEWVTDRHEPSAHYATEADRVLAERVAEAAAEYAGGQYVPEYNGWVNRETWCAALHLSNDPALYDAARVESYQGADALAEWVTDMGTGGCIHEIKMDDGTINELLIAMMADVGSLWRVDWRAVAESLTDE